MMQVGREELLVLKNFTIKLEYIHSVTVGREAPEQKFDQEGNPVHSEDTKPKMVLAIMYFTPSGLQRFRVHGDTEIELIVAYGECLRQMGMIDDELKQLMENLTNELHPDGITAVPEIALVDRTKSSPQPASISTDDSSAQ